MTETETLALTIRLLGIALGLGIISPHLGLFALPVVGVSLGMGIASLVAAGRYRVVPGTPIEVVRRD